MPKFYQDMSKEQRIEQLLKPLPEGTKCLEPPPIRPPKPTDTQVLSTLKLLAPVTAWDDLKGFLAKRSSNSSSDFLKQEPLSASWKN
ncbi:MAG: hypothetical protein J5682_09015 [Prevotella sp.]|nr:hypothetical protein [Prevotella sp.]